MTKEKEEKPKSELAKQAEKRPDNYEDLPPSLQWEIDKALGLLDWDGT